MMTAARLGEECSPDAVLMRTVADQCGSAMAPLYKEFSSRANLIIATAEVLVRDAGTSFARVRAKLGPAQAVAVLMEALTEAALAVLASWRRYSHSADVPSRRGPFVARLRQHLVEPVMRCVAVPSGNNPVRLEIMVDVWFSHMLASVQRYPEVQAARALVTTAVYCVMGTRPHGSHQA